MEIYRCLGFMLYVLRIDILQFYNKSFFECLLSYCLTINCYFISQKKLTRLFLDGIKML